MGHNIDIENGVVKTTRGYVECFRCGKYQTWISRNLKPFGRKEFVCHNCNMRSTFQIVSTQFSGGTKPRCKFTKKPSNMPRRTLIAIVMKKNSER